MLANEPTRSYIGPTRGRAQLYLRSTYVHRSSNHNTKSQKNLVVVIHPYDRTRPTNTSTPNPPIITHPSASIPEEKHKPVHRQSCPPYPLLSQTHNDQYFFSSNSQKRLILKRPERRVRTAQISHEHKGSSNLLLLSAHPFNFRSVGCRCGQRLRFGFSSAGTPNGNGTNASLVTWISASFAFEMRWRLLTKVGMIHAKNVEMP